MPPAKLLLKSSRLRMLVVALSAYILFGHLLIPLRIQGQSMEPTYMDGGFNFCWRLHYLFSQPQRGDVVAIRFAGRRVMLLKRIVALDGDIVEIRDGILFINHKQVNEPHVRYPSDWNLQPRQVGQGKVYVIGDNRSVPIEQHQFGQVTVKRIVGGVLW